MPEQGRPKRKILTYVNTHILDLGRNVQTLPFRTGVGSVRLDDKRIST